MKSRLTHKDITSIKKLDGGVFKLIPNYNNRYFVSTHGRVASICGESVRIMKPNVCGAGYLNVVISHKKRFYPKVHRLVAFAFIPNSENKKQINHKDGNKKNNHISNLEWVSAHENMRHAVSTGLKNDRGGNHPFARKVIDTSSGKVFNSIVEAANHLGLSRECLGRRIRKQPYSVKYYDGQSERGEPRKGNRMSLLND